MLTAMGYCSLPQENSDQPLVFQVTRVSSAPLEVLRGVQWPAPLKTVGLHLTAQVMRIWLGSVTDGNIFPEADVTHTDYVSDSEGCIDLSGPVPAMPDKALSTRNARSSSTRELPSVLGARQCTGK